MRTYSAFGLTIASEVELVGVAPAPLEPGGSGPPDLVPPDVVVRWGSGVHDAPIESTDADGWFEFTPQAHRFGWPELGVVEIVGGRDVTIWTRSEPPAGLVEHVLLGPILADIVLSRGMLPIHASANLVGSRVVAFIGRSGDGKSTISAALHEIGHRSHGDDLVAVPCGPDPLVYPGISRIKLNVDSLSALGHDPKAFQPTYAGIDKRVKNLDLGRAWGARRLSAIYRLVDADDVHIAELAPTRALFLLAANCFRIEVEQHAFGGEEILRRCARILDTVPMFDLCRPRDFSRLHEVANAVVGHAETLFGRSA